MLSASARPYNSMPYCVACAGQSLVKKVPIFKKKKTLKTLFLEVCHLKGLLMDRMKLIHASRTIYK